MNDPHRVIPGSKLKLAKIPTTAKSFHPNRKAAEKEFTELRKELRELQFKLYAEDKQKLLIVLQAMDAGGKDGTIRRVFQGVNPQGVRVTSFKGPSKAELAHDYLWRVHKVVPAKGMIGVFNRSHYEDVLVVRVHNYVPESVWQPRYAQINNFESLLANTGTTILKFYLHISQEEQKERFRARLEDPTRNWKFSKDDLVKSKYWDDYMAAFADIFQKCSPDHAPWYIIPADQKWYRNLAITRVIVETLRQMNPQFPPPEAGLDEIVIA